jgi:hypothetical protein
MGATITGLVEGNLRLLSIAFDPLKMEVLRVFA